MDNTNDSSRRILDVHRRLFCTEKSTEYQIPLEGYSLDAEYKELFSMDVNDVIDENGKIVAIKNSKILQELKVAHVSGRPFAEYDVLYKYYADKTSLMSLSEWSQLLNAINWSDII